MKLSSKTSIVLLLFLFYPLSAFAGTWAVKMGGEFGDEAKSVLETSDGGFVIGGSSQTSRPDLDSIDYWIFKLDANGDMVWQKSYDDSQSADLLKSLQETSDKGFVAAGQARTAADFDILILKLDSSGDIMWQKTYDESESDDTVDSVQETSDGGFIVCGATQSFGDMPSGAWIFKLDENGEVVWQKTYGGKSLNASSILETVDGDFIVTGSVKREAENAGRDYLVMKLDNRGDVIWQYAYDSGHQSKWANAVKETSDGGFIVAGKIDLLNENGTDASLFKLDSMGNLIWQKTYGDYGFDLFSDLQITSDGKIIVTGRTGAMKNNQGMSWILKLDGSGNIIWQKVENGDPVHLTYNAIEETSDGGFIVVGDTDPESEQGTDVLVLKLDGDGNIPDCQLMKDANVKTSDIPFTRYVLDKATDETDVTVRVTSIEPIDTNRVPTTHCPDPGVVDPISSDFDADEDGFSYHDDTFKGTHQSRYAAGAWAPNQGVDGSGGLHVSVGGVDSVDIIDGMSGGWSKSFTIDYDSDVEINLSYSLETFRFDADECAEALVAIDGEVVYVLDKLCGRGKQTGWVSTSFGQFLSEGAHTLTVGAYNNKKTGPREKADAYFDDISIVVNAPHLKETQCADGIDNDGDLLFDCDDSDCRGTSECPKDPYMVETFHASHDVFVYQDDLFQDTTNASYAHGQWVEEGRSGIGGLQLTLGNVDYAHILDGISGGWNGYFGMTFPSEVIISIDYRLVMTRFDTDECAQVLAKVDDGPVEILDELCGRGKDTGWQTYTFSKSLLSGDHKLSIGGFLNKKTGMLEKADIFFDNIEVR